MAASASRSALMRTARIAQGSLAAPSPWSSSSSSVLHSTQRSGINPLSRSRNLYISSVSRNKSVRGGKGSRGGGGGGGDSDESDAFARPGPPPLPPSEQREFERLVREKANAPQFKPASLTDDKHPNYRAKPSPEFDGETNPNTGEVGGPKNNPLNWEKEWTYGGRSTDF